MGEMGDVRNWDARWSWFPGGAPGVRYLMERAGMCATVRYATLRYGCMDGWMDGWMDVFVEKQGCGRAVTLRLRPRLQLGP